MMYKNEISSIMFRYADTIILKSNGEEILFKGFIYRKKRNYDSRLEDDGISDRDDEYSLVADNSEIKKGDIIKFNEREFYISEVSPLCIKDISAGVMAKAIMIKN